jgi:methyl-accepting chemotaxis protein
MLVWPLRRFFDPRFAGVERVVAEKHQDLANRLDEVNRRLDLVGANVDHFATLTTEQLQEFRSLLAATIDTTNEASIVVGRTLSELLNAAEETHEAIERTAAELRALQGNAKLDARVRGR